MEAPTLPLSRGFKAVGYSVLLILWWVGVWGIANTVIHMVFKGNTFKELGVYVGLVGIILVIVFLHPDVLERMEN